MAQHDYDIANQSGAAFRADLNNALQAIVSNNSGAAAPSTTYAHQVWVDTSTSPATIKRRDAANAAWVTVGSTTGSVYVPSGSSLGVGTSTPQARLEVQAPSASRSYTSSVLDFSNIHLNGITAGTTTSALTFTSAGGGGAAVAFSRGGSSDTEISFWTNSAGGASAATQRMVIDSSGEVLVGTTTVRARLTLEKAFGGGTAIDTNTTTASTTYSAAAFRHNGTLSGSIAVSTTATTYATSSDYRLKENIEPVADGITRLKQLNPSRFNFIADPDTTVDGFIAHEVQVVVPEAITGEKDAEDDDGNPIYQGIDQSKLVPLLTAALQEAIAKIETLEAKVAALEAA